MRLTSWQFLAAISLTLTLLRVDAAIRPRYGGTLHVEIRAKLSSLDPTEPSPNPSEAAAKDKLTPLVFNRLVRLDRNGRPRAALAASWQHDPDYKRWQFHLRPGVTFHDGTPLTTAAVGGALHRWLKDVSVAISGNTVLLRFRRSMPQLLVDLARPGASIVARSSGGGIVGTGPFRITGFDAGREIDLAAFDDYWGGRPFLDNVVIMMGRPAHDQFFDLELGKADLIEVPPNGVRRASNRGSRIWSSAPVELLALRFGTDRAAAKDGRFREALSLSIDRTAIWNVLLQKQGEVSGALLPEWLSGYAFLFPTSVDLQRARSLVAALPESERSLRLVYDVTDPLARVIADRIAVNARDAGITLRVSGERPGSQMAGTALQLVRVRIDSFDPAQALTDLAESLGLSDLLSATPSNRPEALYQSERTLLDGFRVIPLLHLPEIWATSSGVRNWMTASVVEEVGLALANVWLEANKP